LTAAAATVTDTKSTLTFSAAPGIAAGDEIYVQNVGSLFNGTWTVESISGSTVSYVNSAITADATGVVGSGSRVTVSNSVTETYPAPTPTASLASVGSAGEYNVPGSVSYNADVAIDNIIVSNED
jgi:hypothetical protein